MIGNDGSMRVALMDDSEDRKMGRQTAGQEKRAMHDAAYKLAKLQGKSDEEAEESADKMVDSADEARGIASYIGGFGLGATIGGKINSAFSDKNKFKKNSDGSFQRKDGGTAKMDEHGDFHDEKGGLVKNSDMAPDKNYGKGGAGRLWDSVTNGFDRLVGGESSAQSSVRSNNSSANHSTSQDHNPNSETAHSTETKHGSSFKSNMSNSNIFTETMQAFESSGAAKWGGRALGALGIGYEAHKGYTNASARYAKGDNTGAAMEVGKSGAIIAAGIAGAETGAAF